jgi:putative flippase GtrA
MLARDLGWAVLGRPARYAVVSLMAGGFAQGGLALAYGVLGWGSAAATLLSLAVSIGPSYWGSRTYVWAGRGSRQRRRQATVFATVAVAGSLTAMTLTALAERIGSLLTQDRVLLTAWVCAGSIGATALVWITRYAVLDRLVFVEPPHLTSPEL